MVALFLQGHKVLFATWKVSRWWSHWTGAWERIRLRRTRNSPNAFDHFRSSEDILDLRLQPCFHCWSPCLQSVWCVAILPPSPCTHLCLDTTYVAWQTVSGIKRSLCLAERPEAPAASACHRAEKVCTSLCSASLLSAYSIAHKKTYEQSARALLSLFLTIFYSIQHSY